MKNIIRTGCLISALLAVITVQAALPPALQNDLGNKVIENRIKIEAPHLAENGAVVPIKIIHIDVPNEHYVSEIAFYSGNNTQCPIARYTLTPSMLSEGLGARVKLAKTTDIYAIAKLDDGRILTGERQVKVTVGGCGGTNDVPDFSQMDFCKKK
jgi:sulfur-oxidizing protein SoxY